GVAANDGDDRFLVAGGEEAGTEKARGDGEIERSRIGEREEERRYREDQRTAEKGPERRPPQQEQGQQRREQQVELLLISKAPGVAAQPFAIPHRPDVAHVEEGRQRVADLEPYETERPQHEAGDQIERQWRDDAEEAPRIEGGNGEVVGPG